MASRSSKEAAMLGIMAVLTVLPCYSAWSIPNFGRFSQGSCNANITTVQDLDKNRYMGRWYKARGLQTEFTPEDWRCIAANYQKNGNGTFDVRNSIVNPFEDPVNGYSEICGYMFQEDPDSKPGVLSMILPGDPGSGSNNYWILGTDYSYYSCIYYCKDNDDGTKFEYAWTLTRDQEPSQVTINIAREVFLSNGIDADSFVFIPQGDLFNCIYEPLDGPNCLAN